MELVILVREKKVMSEELVKIVLVIIKCENFILNVVIILWEEVVLIEVKVL